MRYTIPDYYKKFRCIAGDCPATCCAGWQIVIDDAALKKYMDMAGVKRVRKGIPVMKKQGGQPFGSRLVNSIDWENKTFLQYDGRCAFLDEHNLCDIYTEAGEQYFCRTCRNYPRHIEEFENEREISLSLSCPVVARMLLDRQEKVQFISRETEQEEQDESFDEFLYFILQDCRSEMFEILQNREQPITFRIAKVLALAHDIQNRIDAEQIFEVEAVLERYQREGADEILQKKFEAYQLKPETLQEAICVEKEAVENLSDDSQMKLRKNLMDLLYEMEILDLSWPDQVRSYKKTLYGSGAERYTVLRETYTAQMPWLETEAEQLMVYFLFTYFCGAVYDGDAFSKVKLAAVCTMLIQEMELAEAATRDNAEPAENSITDSQKQKSVEKALEGLLTLEERAQIAWRFSRELEHSDLNLETMEKLMKEDEAAEFKTLLRCIC